VLKFNELQRKSQMLTQDRLPTFRNLFSAFANDTGENFDFYFDAPLLRQIFRKWSFKRKRTELANK